LCDEHLFLSRRTRTLRLLVSVHASQGNVVADRLERSYKYVFDQVQIHGLPFSTMFETSAVLLALCFVKSGVTFYVFLICF